MRDKITKFLGKYKILASILFIMSVVADSVTVYDLINKVNLSGFDKFMEIIKIIFFEFICKVVAPFALLWYVLYLYGKQNKIINELKTEQSEKLNQLQNEQNEKDLKHRKELFEVARMVKVLYSIAEYKDREIIEGRDKYTTPLSVLSNSMDSVDLQVMLNDSKLILESLTEAQKNEKKIFYELYRGLSILQDQNLRTLIKEEYNKNNPKIR